MRPFVVNGHGRLVFPSNFSADLDFSVLETLEQLEAVVIRRDFEAKAPTGTEILERVESGAYRLARRAAARPRDEPGLGQPLRDDDVREAPDPVARPPAPSRRRLPAAADALGRGRAQGRRRRARRGPRCRATWDAEAEDRHLHDPVRHLPPQAPPRDRASAREADRGRDHERPGEPHVLPSGPRLRTTRPTATRRSSTARRRSPSSSRCTGWRWCSTTSTRGTWPQSRLEAVGEIGDDDFVVAFVPRSHEVLEFIRRVRAGRPARPRPAPPAEARAAGRAARAPWSSASSSALMPRLESLAVVKGEHRLHERGPRSATPPTAGRR